MTTTSLAASRAAGKTPSTGRWRAAANTAHRAGELSARGLAYIEFLSHYPTAPGGRLFPSVRAIAEGMGVSESTVHRARREVEGRWVVVSARKRTWGDHRQTSNTYAPTTPPEWATPPQLRLAVTPQEPQPSSRYTPPYPPEEGSATKAPRRPRRLRAAGRNPRAVSRNPRVEYPGTHPRRRGGATLDEWSGDDRIDYLLRRLGWWDDERTGGRGGRIIPPRWLVKQGSTGAVIEALTQAAEAQDGGIAINHPHGWLLSVINRITEDRPLPLPRGRRGGTGETITESIEDRSEELRETITEDDERDAVGVSVGVSFSEWLAGRSWREAARDAERSLHG